MTLPRAATHAVAALGGLLFFLFLLLLSPNAAADGEPLRVVASVTTRSYDDGVWNATVYVSWTNSDEPTVTDYAINIDGTRYDITFEDVPFHPNWSRPVDGVIYIVTQNSTAQLSVSALAGSSAFSTSCNVTVDPTRTYLVQGLLGTGTRQDMCGEPVYRTAFRMQGIVTEEGSNLTFRLNHSLSARNVTTYGYQLLVFGFGFPILPDSSFTYGAATTSQPALSDGYRLTNFSFPYEDVSDSTVSLRVRAVDGITFETSDWSCILSLEGMASSFAVACTPPRVRGIDSGTPSLPFVNVATMALGLGVPVEVAAAVIAGIIMALLGLATTFIGRDSTSAAAGVAVGAVLSFQAALIPGWVILIVVYFATIIGLNPILGSTDQ